MEPLRAIERACSVCGVAFVPRSKTHRYCPAHELRGREHRSPSTQAQDAEYARNRRALLADRPRCALRIVCHGAPATTADHILPVSRGGGNERSNLQPACGPCNYSKGARTTGATPTPQKTVTTPLRLS